MSTETPALSSQECRIVFSEEDWMLKVGLLHIAYAEGCEKWYSSDGQWLYKLTPKGEDLWSASGELLGFSEWLIVQSPATEVRHDRRDITPEGYRVKWFMIDEQKQKIETVVVTNQFKVIEPKRQANYRDTYECYQVLQSLQDFLQR